MPPMTLTIKLLTLTLTTLGLQGQFLVRVFNPGEVL